RVLGGGPDAPTSDPGRRQADRDLEGRCREEVEAFALDFFALAPAARRRRWEELRAACAPFASTSTRLAALGRGLDLDPSEPDGPAGQLARAAAELFVLRPGPRAARRRQLLEQWSEESDFWEQAAAELKRHAPKLAALEPVLLGSLNQWWHQKQAR